MTTERRVRSLLSLVGVTSAQDMVGSTLVQVVFKNGVEVCEIVWGCLYLPKSTTSDEREFLSVTTELLRCDFTRKKDDKKVYLEFIFNGGEVSIEDLVSLSVGEIHCVWA